MISFIYIGEIEYDIITNEGPIYIPKRGFPFTRRHVLSLRCFFIRICLFIINYLFIFIICIYVYYRHLCS
jgi:hypothetical protein